jgi:hypothetical protein
MPEKGARLDQVRGLEFQLQNLLTNPDFEIWQRGDGPFGPDSARKFTADEWLTDATSGGCTYTITKESSDKKAGNHSLKLVHTYITGADPVSQVQQGIEAYKSLEGLWLTLSVWVKSNSNTTRIMIRDYTGTATHASTFHSGSGNWERLTVRKLVRTGLIDSTVEGWPHGCGLLVEVRTQAAENTTVLIDGATLVIGDFPEGVPFVPLNPAIDIERCTRFFQAFAELRHAAWTASAVNFSRHFLFPTTMKATPVITIDSWTYGNANSGTLQTVYPNQCLHRAVSTVAGGRAYAYATGVKLEVT